MLLEGQQHPEIPLLPKPFQPPAIYRPRKGRLYVATPFQEGNREWLTELGTRPGDFEQETKTWRIARNHLRAVLDGMLDRWKHPVRVYADFNRIERCAKSCQQAKFDDCTCSCLGRDHAGGLLLTDWREVGPYVLLRDGETVRQQWIVNP